MSPPHMMSPFLESFIVLTVIGALIGIAVRILLPRILAWRGVWFTWRTKFGPALVFDSADEDGTVVRLLNVGGTFQSVCYTEKNLLWDPVCEYHRSWALAVHAAWPKLPSERSSELNSKHRALVMGGGGFSFPKWIVAYRPDFTCTTVEIDPAIVQVARERFYVNELERTFCTKKNDRLKVITDDAWSYLSADDGRYDLIVNDAFRGNKPLGHINTRDGAKLIHAHLTSNGLYIGNVRTPLAGSRSLPLWDAADTFLSVFGNVWIVPERPEDTKKPGNNALIACKKELDLGTISGAMQYKQAGKGVNTWQTIS